MIGAAWLLAAGLALAAPPADHASASAASAPVVVDVDRQNTLAELRERKIIAAGAEFWKPEDMALLGRLRRAEKRGAFALLREEIGNLRGFVVEHRTPKGRIPWLTKQGFDKFQFLSSQRARQYFEEQGVDAKFIFKLKDPLGKKLFTSKGILTPEGQELYERASSGISVRWMDPSGKVVSSGTPRPSDE